MADTRVQLEAEDWVRRECLPQQFGQKFSRERMRLSSGGVFEFDAVSGDDQIVASISTSRATTASGKAGVGKMHKIRADMYFLLLCKAEKRVVVLTENDMYERLMKDMNAGRVPACIEFLHVELPSELDARLREARRKASKEVRPRTEDS